MARAALTVLLVMLHEVASDFMQLTVPLVSDRNAICSS